MVSLVSNSILRVIVFAYLEIFKLKIACIWLSMSKIRTTKNTIVGPFIAYIQETGQTYDSVFVFVFICIKGNIRGG